MSHCDCLSHTQIVLSFRTGPVKGTGEDRSSLTQLSDSDLGSFSALLPVWASVSLCVIRKKDENIPQCPSCSHTFDVLRPNLLLGQCSDCFRAEDFVTLFFAALRGVEPRT